MKFIKSAIVASIFAVSSSANAGVISFEDFNGGATDWSNNATYNIGSGNDILGRFGKKTVSKLYDFGVQNAGIEVTIDFLMYEIDSWDNETFTVQANGIEDNYVLSHPGKHRPIDITDGGTLIPNIGNSGTYYFDADEVHNYSITTNLNATGQLNLSFSSNLNQHLNDESWGIDNIAITSAVPEPSTYAMMIGGLGLVGLMAARRKKQA